MQHVQYYIHALYIYICMYVCIYIYICGTFTIPNPTCISEPIDH